MSAIRLRHPAVLAVLSVAALAACAKREEASPPPTTQPPPSTAAVTTTTTTTLPSPPPIWRSAHWGMKQEEVLAAFPGEAQRLGQPIDFAAPMAGSTDVGIPAYETDGTRFRVLFGFDGDALNRMQLSAIKPAEATCGDVEKILTDKNGAASERNTTQTNMRTEQIVWRRPDQTITLVCSEARGLGYRSVTLGYTTPGRG
jgi:hypothetical protein